MKKVDVHQDMEDATLVETNEDGELLQEIRDDEASSSAPGDGDNVALGEGLIILRQPKQSDADIATAEFSTVRLRVFSAVQSSSWECFY